MNEWAVEHVEVRRQRPTPPAAPTGIPGGAAQMLSLQRAAGNAAVERLVQLHDGKGPAYGGPVDAAFVQRWKDGRTSQDVVDLLEADPAGPDGGRRDAANALYKTANSPAERLQVKALVDKFSRPAPVVGPPQPKPWQWSTEEREIAVTLGSLFGDIRAAASRVAPPSVRTTVLRGDPRDTGAGAVPSMVVPLKLYTIDSGGGLALWAGLLDALEAAQSASDANTVHRVTFVTPDGNIEVVFSQHNSSATTRDDDYFVHDLRAGLVYHSQSGVQQDVAPGPDPKAFEVSYEAFLSRLRNAQLEMAAAGGTPVPDSQLARAALAIVKSPTNSGVRALLPHAQEHHVSALYELVTTWMVAETERHGSSMVSSVIQLELVARGQLSFEDSLRSLPTSHPMSHVGSESQGRDLSAEVAAAINAGSTSLTNPRPASAVVHKQAAQFQRFGDEAAVRRLMADYLNVAAAAVSSGIPLVASGSSSSSSSSSSIPAPSP